MIIVFCWNGEDGNQLGEDPRCWRQGIHLLCLSCPKPQLNPLPPEASETTSVPEGTPLWTFQQGPLFYNCKEFWNLTQAINQMLLWVSRFLWVFLMQLFCSANCIVKIKQAQYQVLRIHEKAEMTRESWKHHGKNQIRAKLMATIIWSDSLGGQSLGLERVMNFLASQETEDNITQNLLCSRMQFPPRSTEGSFFAAYIFLSTSSAKVLKTGKAAQNSKRSCTNSFFLHRLLRQSVTEDYR